MERGVPDRQHAVPKAQDVADDALVGLVEQVRLAALGVDVRVRAEEGRERADVVPSHEHLGLGITEEAADIGCGSR